MKIHYPYLIVLVTTFCLSMQCAKAADIQEATSNISKWGKVSNPDGDCKFIFSDNSLLINVPGSHPHDLAPEIDRTNAPRILQPVTGDFLVQVQVQGRFAPGKESTEPVRLGYNGAGIVVMLDNQNVVTLARAVYQRTEKGVTSYVNFEIRVNGKVQRLGLPGDYPLPEDKNVLLRLERRDSKFLGSVSLDGGINWDQLTPKKVPLTWPKKLQTGVVAISTSKNEFNPQFSDLKITE